MGRRKGAASTPAENHASQSTEVTKHANSNGGSESTKLGMEPSPELEPVKVNNANLTELKIACDDAVRRVCPSVPP